MLRELEKNTQLQVGPGRYIITVGSVMAIQTLIEIATQMFNKTKLHSTKNKKKSHEDDLNMWSRILEVIIRLDCVLCYLTESKPMAAQSMNSGKLGNMLTLDTNHLVDFNKIQRRVNSLSTLAPKEDSGSGSHQSDDFKEDAGLKTLESVNTWCILAGSRSLDLTSFKP